MAIWFQSKVNFIHTDANGKERKSTELYLLDAVTYTEAEARMNKILEEHSGGQFEVSDLKKTPISELFPFEDADYWFQCKVSLVDVDEESGKEKHSNKVMMVAANDLREAMQNIEKSLDSYIIPMELLSIQKTNIVDVFPYNPEESVKNMVPDNFKKVEAK